MSEDEISIIMPDDWHVHLRDGEALSVVVADSARRFGRFLVMPNLKPPVTDLSAAVAYRQRITEAMPVGLKAEALMTLYLTDRTTPAVLRVANASGFVPAAKLYPAGATTNSDGGVTDIKKIDHLLATMAEIGMVLCVHGEVTDPEIDIFDREHVFIEQVLKPLILRHPKLKVVLEHITTRQAVDFVRQSNSNISATITAHHLRLNRNAMLVGGMRPHNYCLPVLKREEHRLALVAAATSGEECFFLGTDSAPHSRSSKESACGCAGCYTAHAGIELYAEVFEDAGALDKLEGFASVFGARFYGYPVNKTRLILRKNTWQVAEYMEFIAGDELIPFAAGHQIRWQIDSK